VARVETPSTRTSSNGLQLNAICNELLIRSLISIDIDEVVHQICPESEKMLKQLLHVNDVAEGYFSSKQDFREERKNNDLIGELTTFHNLLCLELHCATRTS
jgi:hypothetical protein